MENPPTSISKIQRYNVSAAKFHNHAEPDIDRAEKPIESMNILVLDEFADSYAELLTTAAAAFTYATSLDGAGQKYDILLAQPDLAADYLQRGGKVAWIQSTWAGIRPLAERLENNSTIVTGVKNVFGPQIAEYVFTYVLEELRNPDFLRSAQKQKQWQPTLPGTASGRHMVIVGAGSIGHHLAGVAASFGMRTTGVSRTGANAPNFDAVLPVDQLPRAVADADYVVLALPDTTQTNKLIDENVFSAMKKQPLLFNVGRGSSLDENALLSSLRTGKLRGAVLDVFNTEPLPNEAPLWDEPGVVITPHIAAVSFPADIAKVFLENLAHFEAGRSLNHVIDLTQGY